jgi:hypothetical protein
MGTFESAYKSRGAIVIAEDRIKHVVDRMEKKESSPLALATGIAAALHGRPYGRYSTSAVLTGIEVVPTPGGSDTNNSAQTELKEASPHQQWINNLTEPEITPPMTPLESRDPIEDIFDITNAQQAVIDAFTNSANAQFALAA